MRKLVPACALLVAIACDPTALRVLIAGEQRVPAEIDELRLVVQGDGAEASSRFSLENESPSLNESLTLLPGERINDQVQISVDGLLDDEVVARGHAEAAFERGAERAVEVTLRALTIETDAGPSEPDGGPVLVDCRDGDGDGYGDGAGCLGFDCDDDDRDVHPGAVESCNEIDDDCDFATDEGCPCSLAANHACGTLRGVCSLGWQTCGTGVWSDCDGASLPRLEVCNGVDDDCDGQSDEGCP